MGACLTKTDPAAPWPDLPPEIAGLIFCRVPSHDDRRSFRAVCRSWRLAARQQGPPPPPPMPCINLGYGAYQSLTDGKIRRFPTPKRGYRVGASFGGWLFSHSDRPSSGGRCFLRGPSSAAAVIEVPTSYHHKSPVDFPTAMDRGIETNFDTVLIGPGTDMKMVVCSSQLVAALFRHPENGHYRSISYLASFRPGKLQQRQLSVCYLDVQPYHRSPMYDYADIAFFHGKVFALSSWQEELYCHDLLDGDKDHYPLPLVSHDMDGWKYIKSNCYLVVSSDKKRLLMVRWRRGNDQRPIDLWVFEPDFGAGRWLEVKDLGDQILFVGRNCSMAFATTSSEHWGPSELRGGNRVFVLGSEWTRSLRQPVDIRDTPSYCVYDMATRETSMVSLKGPRYTESCTSGWFFPEE